MKMARQKPWCFPDTHTHTHTFITLIVRVVDDFKQRLIVKICNVQVSSYETWMRHMFVLDPFWRMLINHLSSLIVYKYLLHVDVPKNFINDLNKCFLFETVFVWQMLLKNICFFGLFIMIVILPGQKKRTLRTLCLTWEGEAAMLDLWWLNSCGPSARGLRPKRDPKMTRLETLLKCRNLSRKKGLDKKQKTAKTNLCIRSKFKWLEAWTQMMGGVTKFPFISWKIPVHGVNFLQVPMLNFRWCKHMAESKSFSNQVADPSGLSYVDAMEPWTLESMMKVCKGWDWSWWMIYGDWNGSPGGTKIFLFFLLGGRKIIDSKGVECSSLLRLFWTICFRDWVRIPMKNHSGPGKKICVMAFGVFGGRLGPSGHHKLFQLFFKQKFQSPQS